VDPVLSLASGNLRCTAGRPFLGVLTGWIPPVVANTRVGKGSIRALLDTGFSQLHHFKFSFDKL